MRTIEEVFALVSSHVIPLWNKAGFVGGIPEFVIRSHGGKVRASFGPMTRETDTAQEAANAVLDDILSEIHALVDQLRKNHDEKIRVCGELSSKIEQFQQRKDT